MRKEGSLTKKRIMYVDEDFRNYIEKVRKKFLEENGMEIPYSKITKLAAERLQESDFESDIQGNVESKRKRRHIIFEI